ncbi:STAS domain-containing protein [Streptomyces sp. NPDC003273]|uniref:STAS domain-containing protein n=1 Tax=Streptomyces sp. NPDC003273 TaxID=3364678 RepID=UPI0036A342B6
MVETENAYQAQPLEVTSTATDGITVVSVAGEIDHNSAGPLIDVLGLDVLGDSPRVVVDLRRVSFMDSSGINVLLGARRDIATAGGWLRLAGVQPSVMRVLEIVGVHHIIPCYPSLREALSA